MDKSWTLLDDRRLEAYEVGCQAFLDYAFVHSAIDGQIRCPCKNCRNKKFGDREFVHYHLLFRGIDKQYGSHLWVFHNEKEEVIANCVVSDKLGDSGFGISENGGDMDEMLRACLNPYVDSDHLGNDDSISESSEFFKLIKEANTPLYDDCKDFSKLSFIIELYQIKSRGKMSDAAFSDILELLKKAFPFITVPKNFYETKKLISKLGCGYTKIDACENDCILFWKDDKDLDKCRVCNSSRWKPQRQGSRTRVSKNILRHFPLIPRLQRLFMSKKSAKDMKWHSEQRSEDGHLRHPADSSAWKDFDRKHQLFASDIRNVRLGLASDGFNPFGTLSTMYSTWPVLLFVYNLPLAMCMKQSNIIMSLLISGSKGPKNAIDVYLQPLMDELKELWGPGVRTLDTSTGKRFDMRAALMWTINDFPAFGNLSGWSTSGFKACPSCADDTVSEHLYKSHKQCFMGHARLPVEGAPPPLTGDEVIASAGSINVTFGVGQPVYKDSQWRKFSIFFQLPYWKDNVIRHNLDVMHIEKNVGELLLKWLLDILEKSDAYRNAAEDIAGIKNPPNGKQHGPRHPLLVPKLHKLHRMTKQDKMAVLNVIADIKVPNGYSSNISRCVNKDKIGGLKSHDYHVLLQQLLPLAIRNAGLPKQMVTAILNLCSFFRGLCSKTNKADDFKKLHSDIVSIMIELEKVFPPAFFVVMMHLPVHLAHEAMVAGPVQYRWMYPVERYLGKLKSYVRNRNCPEGSIAECYVTQECLTFCSNFSDSSQEESVVQDESFGLPIFSEIITFPVDNDTFSYRKLTYEEMEQAHNYCLFNCPEINIYVNAHLEFIQHRVSIHDGQYRWKIQRLQDKEFRSWFRKHVEHSPDINEDIATLSQSPALKVKSFKSLSVRGLKFRTKSSEVSLKTQNSGVLVSANTTCFSTTKDSNPREGDQTYYGVIKDILELSFGPSKKVIVLECDWADNLKNKIDGNGFKLVDLTRPCRTANPFVLSSQILQVFYVCDPLDSPWVLPVVVKPRDDFDLKSDDPSDVGGGCLDIFPIQTDIASSSNPTTDMEE